MSTAVSVVEKCAAELGFYLKEQQKETVVQFTSGKDVDRMLSTDIYRENLVAFVIDEAH